MPDELRDDQFVVEIGGERFDPKAMASVARRRANAGQKKLAQALGVAVDELPGVDREACLVQFTQELETESVKRLQSEYDLKLTRGPNSLTFIERMNSGTARKVKRDSAVRSCIRFWPGLKILNSEILGEYPKQAVELGLIDADDVDALVAVLEALGATLDFVKELAPGLLALQLTASQSMLSAIASLEDVAWISPIGVVTLKNFDTSSITQSSEKGSHPMWSKGLDGKGQVIGVIDSGEIDLLSGFLHDSVRLFEPDITHVGPDSTYRAGPNHRKVVQERKGPDMSYPGADVGRSHATWAVGSAVGDVEGEPGGDVNRGGAYAARVAYGNVTRVTKSNFLGIEFTPIAGLKDEFKAAAQAGARVHTNSWGTTNGRIVSYSADALEADAYFWRNDLELCIVAAPNPPELDGKVDNSIAVGTTRCALVG